MSKLKWLPSALDDLDRLYRFLHTKNNDAAMRAAQTILEGAELLILSPRLGRLMHDENHQYELFVFFASGAYVLRYRLEKDDMVVIVRVWHSRENRH